MKRREREMMKLERESKKGRKGKRRQRGRK